MQQGVYQEQAENLRDATQRQLEYISLPIQMNRLQAELEIKTTEVDAAKAELAAKEKDHNQYIERLINKLEDDRELVDDIAELVFMADLLKVANAVEEMSNDQVTEKMADELQRIQQYNDSHL